MIHTYNRWNYIVNPNTGKVVKLTGQSGKMVIANYIATLERLANKVVNIKKRSARKKKRSRKKKKGKKKRKVLKAVACPGGVLKPMKKNTKPKKSPSPKSPAVRPYDDWRASPSVSPILESSSVMEELTPLAPSPGDDAPEPVSPEPDTPSSALSPFTADETPDPIASTPTPSPLPSLFDKEPVSEPVAPEPVVASIPDPSPEPVPEPVAPEPVVASIPDPSPEPVPVPEPVAPGPTAPESVVEPPSDPTSPFEDEPPSETPIEEEKTPEGVDAVAASAAKAATNALSSVKASVVNLFSPSAEKSPATGTPTDSTP